MNSAANISRPESSHWYYPDGRPCYEVGNRNGGMRSTTLADARKLGLLPSVTTILRMLHKPGLERWLIEMACLAVLTAPRLDNEAVDAFVRRVLETERQQDEEMRAAADLGTRIHQAIEDVLSDKTCDPALMEYVMPVTGLVREQGRVLFTERIFVGDGYAGKADAGTEGRGIVLWDFKSTKKLPNKSWPEHRLQLAAYAACLGNTGELAVRTANIYISTAEPGQIAVHYHDDWQESFGQGFKPLVGLWQYLNGYKPVL